MNLANWLVRTANLHPEKPALVKGTTQYADYREFARRAAAIGGYLNNELGLAKGDRVAIFMPNCTEYLEVLYGVWFAGGVVVPINAKLHEKEAAWIIEDSGAKVVFTCEKYRASLQPVIPTHGTSVHSVDSMLRRCHTAPASITSCMCCAAHAMLCPNPEVLTPMKS